MSNQNVVFKIKNKICREIEVRGDSPLHYRQIKFRLGKNCVLDLLKQALGTPKNMLVKFCLWQSYKELLQMVKNKIFSLLIK